MREDSTERVEESGDLAGRPVPVAESAAEQTELLTPITDSPTASSDPVPAPAESESAAAPEPAAAPESAAESTTVLPSADATELLPAENATDPAAPADPAATELLPPEGSAAPADGSATTELAATEAAADDGDGSGQEAPPSSDLLAGMNEGGGSGRAWKVWTGVGIAVLILAAAYVGGVFYTAERTPAQALVSGIEVGGLDRAEAEAALTDGLADRTDQPFAVMVGDTSATIDPAQAGLTLDAAASIDQITGRSWDPRVLWQRLLGSVDIAAVTQVDEAALDAQLTQAADFVAVPPSDGAIALAGGQAVVTDPVDGQGLDVEAAVGLIADGWLTAEGPIELPTISLTPELDQAAVDAAMAEIVEPLLSAPVTVVAGEERTSLAPEQLAEMATIVGADGRFHLELAPEPLLATVSEALPDIGTAAADARFEFVDGRPSIVPSTDGTGLNADQVVSAVTTAAVERTGRVAELELAPVAPSFTTADAEALGINEVIGEFSTPLPAGNDRDRTANIAQAAKYITGVLLLPGETFSLLEQTAPFNADRGYYRSGVVMEGTSVLGYGGGVSQLSTTLFNAAFEAGLEDVEHKPHSRWFSRYPEGREATLADSSVDLKFRNRTDHGVLVQAWVGDDARVHVQLWGTKTFNTEITTGGRYNVTAPTTVYSQVEGCIAESGGQNGFTVDVRRKVTTLDGAEVENTVHSWRYAPWNKVVCGSPPPPTPPAPADAPETATTETTEGGEG